MDNYTVFCKDVDGTGTTWIDYVEATSVEDAMVKGRAKCRQDWGEECYELEDIQVVGVAEGIITILHWYDGF